MWKIAIKLLKNNIDTILDAIADLIESNPDSKFVESLKRSANTVDRFYSVFNNVRGEIEERISKEDIINELKD